MILPTARELWSHPPRKVRDFGRVLAIVLGLVGLVAGWRAGHAAGAVLLDGACVAARWWLAAIAVASLSWLWPGLLRPVYLVMTLVGTRIGFVVSNLLLVGMYATLFVAIGRLRRPSSPITVGFDPASPTYWKKHGPAAGPERYYRQF